MQDVARAAQVSVATVSRVISGTTKVDDAAAARVWRAVRELNYQVNHLAKSLRVGASRTIAVIADDLGNPFYPELIKGIELAAHPAGLSVMVCGCSGDAAAVERQVQMLLSRRVDGIVMWGSFLTREQLSRLLAAGTEVVGIETGRNAPPGAHLLPVDFRNGMRDVVAYLASLGHRTIAYIQDPKDGAVNPEHRFGHFRAALAEYGLPFREECVGAITGGHRPEMGRAVMLELLARGADFTAVVCHNDLLALGALQAIGQHGLRVPEQISLVGIDDIFTAAFTDPPLTTLSLPRVETGSLALQCLAQEGGGHPGLVIRPRLVVRESTAPVPSPTARV